MVGSKHDLKPFMGQKPDGEFLYTYGGEVYFGFHCPNRTTAEIIVHYW